MANPQTMSPTLASGSPATLEKASERDPNVTSLVERLESVRRLSEALCTNLGPEDCVAQSMPDASPTKWHLAHTTWFFETFVLRTHDSDYAPFHPAFGFLFNSYYNGEGERHPRTHRGVLTRPTLPEILAYRHHVDAAVLALIHATRNEEQVELLRVLEIGLNHEQQHQELILTDVKHLFSQNALLPAYRSPPRERTGISGLARLDLYSRGRSHVGSAWSRVQLRQ